MHSNSYTTLKHPAFPKHSVRIKKSFDFCDPHVKYVSASLSITRRAITILLYLAHTRDILTSKPDISFSISSRAGTILTRTTSFSGRMEVCDLFVIVCLTVHHLGPGCSSSLGLFMELGPCRVKDENSTVVHPEAWNNNANVFFVDQPIGVGFSYADYGEVVVSTDATTRNNGF